MLSLFRFSAVASVGASASQRCPLDTRTLALDKIMLENPHTNLIKTGSKNLPEAADHENLLFRAIFM